jgi:hypothetical protein
MTKMFGYPIWLKVMAIILSLFFLVGALAYFYMDELVLAAAFLMIGSLSLFGVYDAFHYKIKLEDDKITKFGFFRTKELKRGEIAFYKIDDRYLYLLPREELSTKIAISRYIKGFDDLAQWANSHFPNKDFQEFIEEEQEILSDEKFGKNKEEREYSLQQAFMKSKIINTIAWVAVAWGLFYPKPYEYIILLLIMLPLASIVLIWHTSGLIGLGGKETSSSNSARPSIMTAIWMPGMILGLRGLLDYNIYDYKNLIFWCTGLALLKSIILIKLMSLYERFERKDYILWMVLSPILFFFYSFGLIVSSNALLDEKSGDLYFPVVEYKSVTSGKVHTYHLQLSAWGPEMIEEDAEVSSELYNRIEIGDTVVAHYKEGYLAIPWFTIYP